MLVSVLWVVKKVQLVALQPIVNWLVSLALRVVVLVVVLKKRINPA